MLIVCRFLICLVGIGVFLFSLVKIIGLLGCSIFIVLMIVGNLCVVVVVLVWMMLKISVEKLLLVRSGVIVWW